MNTRANNGSGRPGNRHAVVLGGSLAGLVTARVLSDHFENVLRLVLDQLAGAAGHAVSTARAVSRVGPGAAERKSR